MNTCVRCGSWHTTAEEDVGKRLTCTEVKQHWARVKGEHLRLYGHRAEAARDDEENWICFKCGRRL